MQNAISLSTETAQLNTTKCIQKKSYLPLLKRNCCICLFAAALSFYRHGAKEMEWLMKVVELSTFKIKQTMNEYSVKAPMVIYVLLSHLLIQANSFVQSCRLKFFPAAVQKGQRKFAQFV